MKFKNPRHQEPRHQEPRHQAQGRDEASIKVNGIQTLNLMKALH